MNRIVLGTTAGLAALVVALLSNTNVRQKLKLLVDFLFDDRPVIRVRSASPVHVETVNAAFSGQKNDWDHSPSSPTWKAHDEFTVLILNTDSSFWGGQVKKLTVHYADRRSDVDFKAKANGNKFLKVTNNKNKNMDMVDEKTLRDNADATLSSVDADGTEVSTNPSQVFLLPYRK